MDSPEAKLLGTAADRKVYNIIQLVYRARNHEGHSKDYEFSRRACRSTGAPATTMPAAHCATPRCCSDLRSYEGVFTFDLATTAANERLPLEPIQE